MIFGLLKGLSPFVPIFALEYYLKQYATTNPATWIGHILSTHTQLALPRAYALVGIFNVVGVSLTVTALSFRVIKARKKYNIPLPDLYATGDSKEAKAFNCVQRGHQHVLETLPQFIAMSILGGISMPISTAFFGLLWCQARLKWSEGYSTGEPGKRYSHSIWGAHIWTALIGVLITTSVSMVSLLELQR